MYTLTPSSLIQSTQLTANLYKTALGIATRAYETATPVLARAKPILESADGVAVATFDRAEAAFPYAFKTPTDELVGVKQAKAFTNDRVVPLIQPVIQEVLNKTAAINSELGSLQARAAEAIHKSQEGAQDLLSQLRTLADQGKDIPQQLIEGLGKVTTDVKDIVLAKDGTVQEKSQKLASYVTEQVKPIVDEIYRHVLGAKKQAVEATSEVAAKAQDKAAEAAPSQ